MADVAASLKDWSTTASSNSPSDSTTIGAGLADNFQQVQATVRTDLASVGANIASAGTTDIGAVAGKTHHITGTTTITSFGTVAAGIEKVLIFDGILTLTHNATSLILPGAGNITTAAGDVGVFVSEGSGNWRCVYFSGRGCGVTGTATSVKLNLNGSAILTGTSTALSTPDNFTAGSSLGIPAGGTDGQGLMYTSTANFGVFFGSGAPTLNAAKGSLYLRSDGSATNNRAYINTDGATTWTALTTAA